MPINFFGLLDIGNGIRASISLFGNFLFGQVGTFPSPMHLRVQQHALNLCTRPLYTIALVILATTSESRAYGPFARVCHAVTAWEHLRDLGA